jgi:creatinine amidohydrolase
MPLYDVTLTNLTYQQLVEGTPNVVILPWGATEAHNRHLPYAADVIEAQIISQESAMRATKSGARVVVLPAIPFGNNAQHLDQSVTIHFNTITAFHIIDDVCASLIAQNIKRLIIINAHGGNNFKPLVRDLQNKYNMLIIVADILDMIPEHVKRIFDDPGDHAGELETSLLMYLCPDMIDLSAAGSGKRNKFKIPGLDQPGIWTPRPWSKIHPDSGSGNPSAASAKKGEEYFNLLCDALSVTIV